MLTFVQSLPGATKNPLALGAGGSTAAICGCCRYIRRRRLEANVIDRNTTGDVAL
jgi:hypothetical protein